MTPADKIGGIPLWNAHPWQVGLFVFFFDFFTICAIANVYGQLTKSWLWRFKSFLFGDSICLPLAAGFATAVFRQMPDPGHSAFYRQPWWSGAALMAAGLYAYFFEGPAIRERAGDEGNLYHHGIVALVFYLLVEALPALISGHRLWWAFILAIGFAITHIALGLTDQWREANRPKDSLVDDSADYLSD